YAYQKNAPVLFTNSSSLSTDTKKGLQGLKTKNVTVLGGTKSVSSKVTTQLKSMGISVKRISGKNRYDLAANIAKQMKSSSTAVVANGFAYADAVAIAPYAAKQGYPILLTNDKGLRSETSSVMKSRGI
ncbi:cell wall-binding repeat-containing protein, partial [Streptococcus pneumoniae]|nr:cell wall-binding repeat-containing protein [Streptococcus pneumoniae]